MFDSWVESSSVANAYVDLREFIIFDQFLSSLSPELRLFIKERRPAKLKEAIQLADDWASAHNAYPKVSSYNISKKISPRSSTFQSLLSFRSQTPSTMTCHNCGETGHIRPRCPKNFRAFKDGTTTTPTYTVGFCLEVHKVLNFSVTVTINVSWSSSIIRDTRCSGVVVSEEALPDIDLSLCPKVQVADYLGRIDEFPVVKRYLR